MPPTVKLDGAYKFVDDMYKLIPSGAPSLLKAKKLTIEGAKVEIAQGVVIVGSVTVKNTGSKKVVLKKGTYTDQPIEL